MPRRRIKGAAATLAKLNRQGGKRVFIESMADLFDNEVPVEWFKEAWRAIHAGCDLQIQIVTKRLPMIEKRLVQCGYGDWPRHAGLMVTVCNQEEADRDVPRLLDLKHRLGIPWVGLSMEPLLGPVDVTEWLHDSDCDMQLINLGPQYLCTCAEPHEGRLDWIICGGESGSKARPMHPDWARSLRDQCVAAGVPFFFKQWGEWAPLQTTAERKGRITGTTRRAQWHDACGLIIDTPDAEDPLTFFCEGQTFHLGKKAAGRLLDGREWNQFPGAANA